MSAPPSPGRTSRGAIAPARFTGGAAAPSQRPPGTAAPAPATPRRAAARASATARARERRTLMVACGTHMLHDGFSDVLYLLLPLWRREFALAYAEVGMIRAFYVGAMAGLQIPWSLLAERVGGRALLALGTAVAGAGFCAAGFSSGFPLLAAALVLGGSGTSAQHPISSSLVARAFAGSRSRAALATYNFSGDLGKMALPAAMAGLLLWLTWRQAVFGLGGLGMVGAAALWALLPASRPPLARRPLPDQPPAGAARPNKRRVPALAGQPVVAGEPAAASAPAGSVSARHGGFTNHRGFAVLLAIGAIDSATRMAFLTFLPFVLTSKGAAVPTLGAALTLVFAGGAGGKLVCGLIGARIGVLATVFLTEGLTAAGIVLLPLLPLAAALAALPLIGVVLNGTSSVLYGTVPELVPEHRRERAFGIFYTGTIGGGALSPALFGLAADLAGVPVMMGLVAGLVLLTLPLAWRLRPMLAEPVRGG